jgi:hypothetical protein
MPVTYEAQLEVNAIINRLVSNKTQNFAIEDALRLRDFVCVDAELTTPSSRFILRKRTAEPGRGITGHAEGIGNVQIGGDKRVKDKTLIGTISNVWCGRWNLSILAGNEPCVVIADRYANTSSEPPDEYHMVYTPQGDPKALWRMVATVKDYNFWLLSVRVVSRRRAPFKNPQP